MKEKFKRNRLWYKLYADDVVFILKACKLELFLKILCETAEDFNLIMNKKKSAIIAIRDHTYFQQEDELEGIPIVKSYRYLGV